MQPADPPQPQRALPPPPPQQPRGGYPPPPPGPYPPPAGYQQTTVASGGIPTWMHVLYAIGGFFTCGLLWLVWIAHWWFAQSQSKATTTITPTYQPPPRGPQYPPQ